MTRFYCSKYNHFFVDCGCDNDKKNGDNLVENICGQNSFSRQIYQKNHIIISLCYFFPFPFTAIPLILIPGPGYVCSKARPRPHPTQLQGGQAGGVDRALGQLQQHSFPIENHQIENLVAEIQGNGYKCFNIPRNQNKRIGQLAEQGGPDPALPLDEGDQCQPGHEACPPFGSYNIRNARNSLDWSSALVGGT